MDSTLVSDIFGAPPGFTQWARIGVQLLLALSIGALIGAQRERTGKAAGMRTHILVALGTSLFVIASVESGMHEDAVSRVIQGIATGIGFLGAGSILKVKEDYEIHGLTTAAGIWMTAALAVAVGLGQLVIGVVGAVVTWIVLTSLVRLEARIARRRVTAREDEPRSNA
jgi:putative Mg2+ transporter-C (MgtC) family protein